MDQLTTYGGTVTLIHLMRPAVGEKPERWCISCMPNMTEFHETMYHKSYQRTDDPRAVTCPACKKTTAFTAIMDSIKSAAAKRPS